MAWRTHPTPVEERGGGGGGGGVGAKVLKYFGDGGAKEDKLLYPEMSPLATSTTTL